MKVPLLDLKKQYEKIKDEIILAAETVFESQRFILGPKVEELEERIAEYSGCKYAVGVSSGTDALLISLMTAGLGKNDLVITTPYTFFSTAGSIVRVGAEPVFVDIDKNTYNLDTGKIVERIRAMSNEERSRLKAIIPVHLYGQCSEMEKIIEISDKYNLIIIEDAAQAIGSEYEFDNGTIKRAGSFGDYGCFSFFPTKNLGAFGDAGMVTTNKKKIYDLLITMRAGGAKPKYYHHFISGNFRLDALQAAILLIKLKYLDEWTEARINNANAYRRLFKEAGLADITLPVEKEKRHIYHQFVIKVPKKRDELKQFLADNGVGSEIYYPVPIHIQECFKYLNYRGEDFPVSVEAASNTLALPIYPELTKSQLIYVVDKIKNFKDIEK
ncbi:DegT/DnrJ/EryC1/StrS family aminotransferase [Thermodesulfobacteriota bacterium]